ncbi:FkbM family methyltransferase [Roseococcus sp. SDR]|uniref:FkbM family methyltransferase n=1 Tax=Roseococcus sp. SDR TaxID=2835532 RepID=UPI001BCF1586|nr:FkbM family methyltransferase [Roseococcus sp. SDR]MBS7791871.1 FkbM family methyltransferase [Roseococcus sp. SDR]MBV1847185.1 FkbM family methyltransferase [Roseococcus sp. SDR]
MEELDFHRALHRPGVLLDIGAHDGLLTIPFARLPGSRVHAFEPLPSAMARLRAALTAEFAAIPPHVTLHDVALGAAAGEAVLTLPVLEGVAQEQWASISKDYAEHASVTTEAHRVRVLPLDSLELREVTAIKLDAEGAEQEVLEGARRTLTTSRPVLSIEIEERHRPGSTRDVPALLHALGYAGFFWHAGALRPLAEFDAATMQVASPDPAVFAASDPYIFSFFFLPTEMAGRLSEQLQRAR